MDNYFSLQQKTPRLTWIVHRPTDRLRCTNFKIASYQLSTDSMIHSSILIISFYCVAKHKQPTSTCNDTLNPNWTFGWSAYVAFGSSQLISFRSLNFYLHKIQIKSKWETRPVNAVFHKSCKTRWGFFGFGFFMFYKLWTQHTKKRRINNYRLHEPKKVSVELIMSRKRIYVFISFIRVIRHWIIQKCSTIYM